MKPTNGDCSQCINALDEIMKERMNFRTSLAISEFIRKVNPRISDIERLRMDIISRYALINGDGNPIVHDLGNGRSDYSIDPDRRLQCVRELEDLYLLEWDDAPMLQASYFEDLDLPLAVVHALRPFLSIESDGHPGS